jgi:N6-adenosine-specific RNA methylase IME4/ParB-like chromosome segregation protein Spo0J
MIERFRVLEFHPLAEIFPLIEGQDFTDVVADIRARGLREPVVLFEGKILDGRNRYRACIEAGIECRVETYTGNDPVGYVISLNLRRRHLSESQRAMVAAKLATLHDGQRADLVEGLPIGRASKLLNVGDRSVARARTVQNMGAPELIHAVEAGKVSVSVAADIATESPEQQREIVARGEREILKVAAQIRARRAEVRHAERIAKLLDISAGNAPLPDERQYPVISGDPPWEREPGISGPNREIENHYPTMKLADICALPVADLATKDAVLFLWSTVLHLPQALTVIEAWGFKYRTSVVWVKDKIGTGYFVRNQHELLLIAVRGDFPHPLPANRPPSVIFAPRREHSRKPDEAYALIERMYPDLPKIELFARHARDGWACWGNQAPTKTTQMEKANGDEAQPVNLYEDKTKERLAS